MDSIVNPPSLDPDPNYSHDVSDDPGDQSHDDDPSTTTPVPEPTITITLHHHSKPHELTIPSTFTLADLSNHIASTLSIPPQNQKYLISPKPGLMKPPFPDTVLLTDLLHIPTSSSLPATKSKTTKLTLLGSTTAEISSLNASISKAVHPRARPAGVTPARPTTRRITPKEAHARATYTFHTLRPLPYLPRPERSTQFLARLRDDPGIRAAMRTHRFSVPLLTEMDPAAHTTRDSRTLGLNRNRGEVIELRLRTDAYDGYRDYRTIRKTLCHELAHNVFGEHDARFWALTREIEAEVDRADWRHGGRSVGSEDFYNPEDYERGYDEEADHGGWTGGEFVLGGDNDGGRGGGGHDPGISAGLSRREILARAAEERLKNQKGEKEGGGGDHRFE